MLEIDVVLDPEAKLNVGERSSLRIAVADPLSDRAAPTLVRVGIPSTLVAISVSPFLRRCDGRELEFALPAPLRGERSAIEIDVYACSPGTLPIALVVENDGETTRRELTLSVEAHAAFAPEANRFELFACEAEAGTFVEGRAIVTNTGRAAATVESVSVSSPLEDVGVEQPCGRLAPQERLVLRVRGRVPENAIDGTVLSVAATARIDGTEHAVGSAQLVARSRPHLDATLERGPTDWHLRIANSGGALAEHAVVEFDRAVSVPFARLTIAGLGARSEFEIIFPAQEPNARGRLRWDEEEREFASGTPAVAPAPRRSRLDPAVIA
ncbi:MAG: hypothetical protein JO359_03080, partial [Candidatus Eremiobacteraeota bacterium]|nr:hypothetical protein [Candidatus Eremiobacteraeota bacterium]